MRRSSERVLNAPAPRRLLPLLDTPALGIGVGVGLEGGAFAQPCLPCWEQGPPNLVLSSNTASHKKTVLGFRQKKTVKNKKNQLIWYFKFKTVRETTIFQRKNDFHRFSIV
jgi:hypothetical protein